MSSSFEEAPLIQKPGNNNRLLIEDPYMEEEEKESGYLRSGGKEAQMPGMGMPSKGRLAPLITEEDPEQYLDINSQYNQKKLGRMAFGGYGGKFTKARRLSMLEEEDQEVIDIMRSKGQQGAATGAAQSDLAWSLGLPKLQQQKRDRDARRAYDHLIYNKESANPWTKTGQRTERRVAKQFGGKNAKIPFFEKLFGAPAGNFRSKDRAARQEAELQATGKTVGNQKVRATGIGGAFKRFAWRWTNRNNTFGEQERPKMSWMERLFGARRKHVETAKSMGITSPKGKWADQLIDMGDLGEGAENFPGQIEEEKQEQEPGHQSAQDITDSESEEEKVPGNKGMFLGPPQTGLFNQMAMANAHESNESNEYGNPQPNQYGDDNGTIDDNSIDNDDGDYKDKYDKGMLEAYNKAQSDDGESDMEDESMDGEAVTNFVMQHLFKK